MCIVFTLGLGPKLVKLNMCVVFFELVWGHPRSVLTAALYEVPDLNLDIKHVSVVRFKFGVCLIGAEGLHTELRKY